MRRNYGRDRIRRRATRQAERMGVREVPTVVMGYAGVFHDGKYREWNVKNKTER